MDLGIINSNACSLIGMSKAGLGSLNSLAGLNGFSGVGETCFNGTILEYIVISFVIRTVYIKKLNKGEINNDTRKV